MSCNLFIDLIYNYLSTKIYSALRHFTMNCILRELNKVCNYMILLINYCSAIVKFENVLIE